MRTTIRTLLDNLCGRPDLADAIPDGPPEQMMKAAYRAARPYIPRRELTADEVAAALDTAVAEGIPTDTALWRAARR